MNGNTAVKHKERNKSCTGCKWYAIKGRSEPCTICYDYDRWEATPNKQTERNKEDEWAEVMQLAEQYGFIRFAYAGFAMLSIDEEAMEANE
jgi:hypothetical protein